MTPGMSSTLSSAQYKTTKNSFAHLILYPFKSSFHRHQFKGENVNSLLFLLKEQQSFFPAQFIKRVKETNKKKHRTRKPTNQYSTNSEVQMIQLLTIKTSRRYGYKRFEHAQVYPLVYKRYNLKFRAAEIYDKERLKAHLLFSPRLQSFSYLISSQTPLPAPAPFI